MIKTKEESLEKFSEEVIKFYKYLPEEFQHPDAVDWRMKLLLLDSQSPQLYKHFYPEDLAEQKFITAAFDWYYGNIPYIIYPLIESFIQDAK